jgi:hypothetical protein
MSMLGDFRLLPTATIEELAARPESALAFLYDEEVSITDRMSVEKAWHGIHFLLNGMAWDGDPPLDFIVRGGRPLGPDEGHGPARGFTARELSGICKALEPFIPGILRKRFDVDALLECAIYPNQWSGDEGEWLIDTFAQLKRFLGSGAARGLGLVVCIR